MHVVVSISQVSRVCRETHGFEDNLMVSQCITEMRPFKNVDRENANKWKMTLI